MSVFVQKLNVKREQGFLYFVKTSPDGCLEVHKAPMAHKGKK